MGSNVFAPFEAPTWVMAMHLLIINNTNLEPVGT